MKIIAKRVHKKAQSGELLANYRTRYYQYYDGKHAQLGKKSDAAWMEPEIATQVCDQLNAIAGVGWIVMGHDERPSRKNFNAAPTTGATP